MSVSILNSFIRLFFVALSPFLVQCGATPPSAHVSLKLPLIEALQSGDLVFRLGPSMESHAIAAASDDVNRYSHIGILALHDGKTQVIHIEPQRNSDERVKCESLEEFFMEDKAIAGAIVRVNKLSDEQRRTILTSTLAAAKSNITFDHDYKLSDTTRMYCTELVLWAYENAEIDLAENRCHILPLVAEGVVLPCDILQYKDLTTVWQFARTR